MNISKFWIIKLVLYFLLLPLGCSRYVKDEQYVPRPNPSITNPEFATIKVHRSCDELSDNYILVKDNNKKIGALRTCISDLLWERVPGKMMLSASQYRQVRGPDGPWGYSTSKIKAFYKDYSINVEAGKKYEFTVYTSKNKLNNTFYFDLKKAVELDENIIEDTISTESKIAKIWINSVSNKSNKELPVDAKKMIKEEIIKNMKSLDFLWLNNDNGKKIVATIQILLYEDHNEFSSWLLGKKEVSLLVEINLFDNNEMTKAFKEIKTFSVNSNSLEKDWSQAISEIADTLTMKIYSSLNQ